MTQSRIYKIGLLTFIMLNVAAVMSLRGLPMIASVGLSMLFYLFFAAFFFLIPCALISAELASGWPEEGGVYRWIKEALGSKFGFLAIWLQWVQNVIWFPMVLGFAAVAMAYIFKKPELLSNNNNFIFLVIIIIYWLATFINFYGLKLTGLITMIGVILGTILPGLFIIAMAGLWIANGNTIAFLQSEIKFLPNFSNFSNISFLAGIFLLFTGIEINSVHVLELENPRKNYPKAIFIATLMILTIFVLGSLSIATVLPKNEISITAGMMDAFEKILTIYNIEFLLPFLGVFIAFGVLGGVMTWIAGPSKGLLATAKNGEIPPFLAKTNRKGVQTHILIIQGFIVTIISSLYLIMDNVDVAFFLLTAMTVNLYLVMYFLLFLSAIILRYKKPDVIRYYKVPGGNLGMLIIAGTGMIAVIFAFLISFVPPEQLEVGTPILYSSLVLFGLVLFCGSAFIINSYKKTSWIKN